MAAKTSGELKSLTVKEGDRVYDGQLLGSFDSTDMDSQIENARLSIQTAELALQSARDSLEDYSITSPIDGQIIEMNYKAGDNVDPVSYTHLRKISVIHSQWIMYTRFDEHGLRQFICF